jgi:hypothetical protein
MGERESVDYLAGLIVRNRERLLASEMDPQKRAKLLSVSFVMENLGTTQLDVAMRQTVELALMYYSTGEFDALVHMSMKSTTRREGSA